MARRDICYIVGKRAWRMTHDQAAEAWYVMANALETLETKDIPKYRDVLRAIRKGTIAGKQFGK